MAKSTNLLIFILLIVYPFGSFVASHSQYEVYSLKSFLESSTLIFFIFFIFVALIIKFLQHYFHLLKVDTIILQGVIIYAVLCLFFSVHDPTSIDMNGFATRISQSKLYMNIAITIILVVISRIFKFKEYLKFSWLLVVTYLFLNIFNYFYIVWAYDNDKKITFTRNNLIVLSFDGLGLPALDHLLQENENFIPDDFYIIPNVLSNAPATVTSVFSELNGNQNWKLEYKSEGDLLQSAAPSYLDSYGNLYSYGVYNSFMPDNVESVTRIQSKAPSLIDFSVFLNASFCKLGICGLGYKYGRVSNYLNQLPMLDRLLFLSENDAILINEQIRDDLINAVQTATVEDSQKLTGYWGHFNHTHSPIRTNADCNFASDKKIGLHFDVSVVELKCQLELFSKLVSSLKALGIYDSSTIIFKSDHGRSNNVYLSDDIANTSSLNGDLHPRYAAQRYQPILLIKPASQLGMNNIIFDGTVNLLGDLGKTYCIIGQTFKPEYEGCNKFSGRSFIRSSSDAKQKNNNSDNLSAYAYIPKNMTSTHMFGDLQPQKVMRNIDIKNFDQFVSQVTKIKKETQE
jgi:hypothetical protein